MNYMNEVAKLLGVEFEEVFRLRVNNPLDGKPYIKGREYKLTPEGLFVSMDPNRGVGYTKATNSLTQILNGNYSIIKLSWLPKEGEEYYYCRFDGSGVETMCARYSSNFWIDVLNVKIGNCFKTEDEAEANFDAFKTRLEGEPIVDWRTENVDR